MSAPIPIPSQSRTSVKWWLCAGISLGFLVWWVLQTDFLEFRHIASRLSLGQWLLLSVGLWLSYGVRALRMHQEFADRTSLGRGDWLRITVLHNASVNWLPLRAGELAFPWLLKREAGLALAHSLTSLLWLRLQDAAVLVGLALMFWSNLFWGWRVAWLAALVLGLALLPYVLKRWVKRPRVMTGAVPDSAEHGPGLIGWRESLLSPHRMSWYIWAWTLLNWLLKLTVQALALCWLLGVSWPTGWLGAVGAELAVFAPLQGWAGIGTYEMGSALAMQLQGVPLALGLQMVLVVHVWVLFNATLAGLLAGLVTVSGRRKHV